MPARVAWNELHTRDGRRSGNYSITPRAVWARRPWQRPSAEGARPLPSTGPRFCAPRLSVERQRWRARARGDDSRLGG
eukprot:4417465-Prymnesium_polylepis.1